MRALRLSLLAALILSIALSACSNAGSNATPTSHVESLTSTPDELGNEPEPRTRTPGTGTRTPGTGTRTPGTGTQTPNTGAQTPGPASPAQTETAPVPETGGEPLLNETLFSSELLGAEVFAEDDDEVVGIVRGLLLDSITGQLQSVVLDASPSRGLEARLYPLPWGTFQLESQAEGDSPPVRTLRLNAPTQALDNAPALPDDFLRTSLLAEDYDPLNWNSDLLDHWNAYAPLPEPAETAPGVPIRVTGGMLSALDFNVDLPNNDKVGEVRDLILSPEGGVSYAVLETDTFLNLANRLIPLPWKALAWDPHLERFVLAVSIEEITSAPGFVDASEFPDIHQPGWDEAVVSYWEGVESARPESSGPSQQPSSVPDRASQWLGVMVADEQGRSLSPVQDLALGRNGEATYALLSTRQGLAPVPVEMFRWFEESGTLIFTGETARLNSAPVLAGAEAYPQHPGGNWDSSISAYWMENDNSSSDDPPISTNEAVVSTLPGMASQVFNQTFASAGTASEPGGQTLGAIADLILLSVDGPTFVVVDTGEQLVPIPWEHFKWDEENTRLLFTAEPERINSAPGFDSLAQLQPESDGWTDPIMEYWR